MFIKLLGVDRNPFYIRAERVRCIGKNSKNPLETVVETIDAGPNGYLNYLVLDSPEEVAGWINEALGMARKLNS